jgi:hypothetical protein
MKVDPDGGLPPGPGEITGAAAEARAGAQLVARFGQQHYVTKSLPNVVDSAS